MYCKKCGKELAENAAFCKYCGASANEKDADETTVLDSDETSVLTQKGTAVLPSDAFVQPTQLPPVPQKKKKNKGVIIAIVAVIILAFLLICGVIAIIGFSNNDNASNNNLTLNNNTGIVMTDDIYNYQFAIEDIVYQLPMRVDKILDTGLSYSNFEDSKRMISSNSIEFVHFSLPDGTDIFTEVFNFSKGELPLEQCHVTAICFDSTFMSFDAFEISLAKGIKLGLSTSADIKDAFGEASKLNVINSRTVYTYEEDIYKSIELTVDNESDKLIKINIQNLETPTDVENAGVSNEIPLLVTSYLAPTSLGDDIFSGSVEIYGELYKLPIPVCKMIDNGWEITKKEEDTIAGKDYTNISLTRGTDTIETVYVRNYEEYEVPIENGMITKIGSTNMGALDNFDELRLPNDLKYGFSITDSDFKAKYSAYVTDERKSGSGMAYTIEKGQINVCVSIENGQVHYVVIDYKGE